MKKLATTGLAVHLLGGETVHHFFHIDVEGKSHIETGTLAYKMVNATDIIVIDQFIMLDAKTFAAATALSGTWIVGKVSAIKVA